jgi:pimeloyl-ACP methyl ester carboxylesterase
MKAVVVSLLVTTGCAGTWGVVKSPSSPAAWKTYWLEQNRDELTLPKPEPPRPLGGGRTVLLIPGMTISGEMFAPMVQRLKGDGFNPIVYEDADLLTTGVVSAAGRLATRVEEVAAQSGQDRIDIIGECVGGVTARYYVQRLGGRRRVRHLVTFVSPHHGSWPAVIAALVTGWQGLDDIRRNSDLLASLDAEPVPNVVSFTSIYGCSDDLLLPHDTAAVKGAINVELCGDGLGHFDGFWDRGIYDQIVAGLSREGPTLVGDFSSGQRRPNARAPDKFSAER